MDGFILYEGRSQFDGKPIVCIVTDPDQSRLNKKTQRVIQTYILRADLDPLIAVQMGLDHSICGNCMHRGQGGMRSCYVQVWSAPRNVWLAYKAGKYGKPRWGEPEHFLRREIVRLGTYGDPAAVPPDVWTNALNQARAVLGYTHQWRVCNPVFQQWCMASVENLDEARQAQAQGWRTFRVRPEDGAPAPGEVVCPASAAKGMKTHCMSCLACGGVRSKASCNIVITVHGDKGKICMFKEKTRG